MCALRRASTNSIKASGLGMTCFRACGALGPSRSHKEASSSASKPHLFTVDRWITTMTCNCAVPVPKLFSIGYQNLSSQSGAKSGREETDELEDGFSELETFETSETIEADTVDGNSSSDSSLDAGLEETLEDELMGETLWDAGKINFHQKYEPSDLFKSILEDSGQPVSGVLDKYFEDKELGRSEVYKVMLNLHRYKQFAKALQLSEWLVGRTDFDFWELDYAYRIDLIAKVHGLFKAESYIDTIPKSFKAELVYRTLLAYLVSASLLKNSEQLFDKMKDLGLPITVFACNQMLLLYMKRDQGKIADMLSLMVNENISPSIFTYKILIDTKGQSQDIKGMEKIIEIMKGDNLEPDMRVQEILWRYYKDAGLADKFFVVDLQIVWDLFTNMYASTPDMGARVADDFLQRKVKIHPNVRPMLVSYMTVLREYAKMGDAHNARRVFRTMRQAGFVVGGEPFDVLCLAYKNAKLPTNGLREKMKALQSHRNKGHDALLALVEVFKKPKIESYWAEKSSEN